MESKKTFKEELFELVDEFEDFKQECSFICNTISATLSGCRGEKMALKFKNRAKEPNLKTVLVYGMDGSGKSTFAQRLLALFPNEITVISYDNYYKPQDHLEFEERTNASVVIFTAENSSVDYEISVG